MYLVMLKEEQAGRADSILKEATSLTFPVSFGYVPGNVKSTYRWSEQASQTERHQIHQSSLRQKECNNPCDQSPFVICVAPVGVGCNV